MPTQEELREYYKYDPLSGKLTRRITLKNTAHNAYAGKEVGWLRKDGYRGTRFKSKALLVHRIIWVLTQGDIPDGYVIDHLDHNPSNNRIDNLRLVSLSENSQNKFLQSNNVSGRVGVCYQPRRRRWSAQIKIRQKQTHLGYFDTFEKAVAAREAAEKFYSFTVYHGRKSPTNR